MLGLIRRERAKACRRGDGRGVLARGGRGFLASPRERRGGGGALAGVAGVGVGGFADGKVHSDWSAGPIVPPRLGMVTVEGWVVDVASPSQTGARLLIAPTYIEALAPGRTPRRIRVG